MKNKRTCTRKEPIKNGKHDCARNRLKRQDAEDETSTDGHARYHEVIHTKPRDKERRRYPSHHTNKVKNNKLHVS